MPPLPRPDLLRVSSARWLVPILAVLHEQSGGRFGVLVRRLGLSRSVLSRHLDLLEEFGWITRNPGHGHPLRPEYLLTGAGAPIAAWSAALIARRDALPLSRAPFARWTLPVLAELATAPRRFSQLQQTLSPVTPRALSLTITDLRDRDLVAQHSPALYRVTEIGRGLAVPLLTNC